MKAITKGMKVQYHSFNGKGMRDNMIFTVVSTGDKMTVLSPEKVSLTNPTFKILTFDLKTAIELGYYTIVE